MRNGSLRAPLTYAISLVASTLILLCPAVADVVINEIMYRPTDAGDVELRSQEYLELHNTDPAVPVSLDGWRFTKGVDYEFPQGAVIPAAGHLAIAADVAAYNAKYPASPTLLGGWQGQLSNSGERVKLVDAGGVEIDSVEYSDQGDWALRIRESLGGENGWTWVSSADDSGHSLELQDPSLSNANGQNWISSSDPGGTPGAPNSMANADLAPLIAAVKHSPAVPNFVQAVTISAQLEDESMAGITALVRWRLSTDNPAPFGALAMTEPDADGRFEAELPPQAEGAVVEFYVEASDGTSVRTWPAATDQGQLANAHYQVDSTVPAIGEALYRVVMTRADRRQWDTINRRSDAQLNVTFIASEGGNHDVRYRSGLRVRGNSSRTFDPPPMRINIPRETPWNGDTKLNVNSRYSWLQFVGMHFFGASGLPAPDAKRVAFRINGENEARNDGTMRGSFVHLEPIGDELVDDKFPGDGGGNLYKKRSADPDRDEKRWGVHFENQVVYDEPDWYREDDWSKLTNESEDNWDDLQNFVEVMHQAGGEDYLEAVAAVADVDQWCRWFAVMTILNSFETNLSNGIDDDYSMYRGISDTRFVLLPHDLDTIFGEGDTGSNPTSSIFPMLTANIPRQNEDGRIPQLVAFFEHPVLRKKYFDQLAGLLRDEFSKQNFDAAMSNHLGGWATAGDRAEIIAYMDARRAYILGEIDNPLRVTSQLPLVGGLPRTTASTASLAGSYDFTQTSELRVNGELATLDPAAGSWAISGVALSPGINRITVQAWDPALGEVGSEQIDVWYDDGDTQPLAGMISTDQTLLAQDGPYVISGEVVVAPGTTLTIGAGANLYFEAGAQITVNGILRAIGTEFSRVRFGPPPGAPPAPDPAGNGGLPDGPPKWGGIQFVDTISDQNLLSFVDVLHAQSVDGSVGVHRSEVLLDHMGFAGSHLRLVYADSSSVTLQHSTFPDMFAPGESPDGLNLDNISEHVKGEGDYPEGGHFVIRNNVFGTNAGHNDVIDVDSGLRPEPILQILDNVFFGAGDEQLDLGGDVYVAGNVFMNVSKDDETSDRGYANAISTGDAVSGATVVVARNVFWDVDHALNLKRGTAAIFENNTVVKIHPDFDDRFGNPNVGSAINFYVDEPGATPGDGAYAGNNIFWDTPRVFGNADLPGNRTTPLEARHNLVSEEAAMATIGQRAESLLDLGVENRVGDPHFVAGAVGDFRLLAGSPAQGAGLAGGDLGAAVPSAIAISGEPAAITASTEATLTVGGPGMVSYRYRINGGPWSDDLPIGSGFDPDNGTLRTAQVQLTGLSAGSYSVEVLGTDFAGNLQLAPTASETWIVDPDFSQLVINEVLAANGGTYDNGGTFPDIIELYNAGGAAIDLASKSITDDPSFPGKFVFPAGTVIAAGGYLLLHADSVTSAPGLHLGFALDNDGEAVYLFDGPGAGAGLIDSIEFGYQIPGYSVGRVGRGGGEWGLTQVTPGAPNRRQPYGDPARLVINEWLAANEVLFGDDFAELYNPDDLPVPLAGIILAQDSAAESGANAIPPLSYVAAKGFSVLRASGDADIRRRHLDFRLSASHEWLFLFDADLTQIDRVHLQAEGSDVSRGRFPDGAPEYAYFELPTPGLSNMGVATTVTTTTLVGIGSEWAYEQSDTDLGSGWRDAVYDDAAWPRGPGLLYQDDDPLGGPAGTVLQLNPPTTHYFRHSFNFAGNPLEPSFAFDLFADDGAAVYLNGTELLRLRMPAGAIGHSTFASDGQNNASREGPFAIPPGLIASGENVIAVSVHQDDGSSGDVVFGMELRASTTETSTVGEGYARALALLKGLRITEIMYHPAGTEALEFIELQNVGPEPLHLGGVRFSDGISFVFPDMVLEVGAHVIVVADVDAFTARYGGAISIAGAFGGRLNNDGERIVLQLPPPFEAAILRFEYNDSWYRDSDGGGSSLEILESAAAVETWGSAANWRASATPGGTPAAVSPPVITSSTIALTTLGDPFSYRITATNIPSAYAASGLPAGLSLDPQSGQISGSAEEYGLFPVRVSATNGGGTGSDTLTINVAASGPFVGFGWSEISSPQPLGSPVPVTAVAIDAAGRTVVDYNGTVAFGAFVGEGGGSTVLITECWDRSPDYFEIQNVSAGAVDTAGWFVAVNRAFGFGGGPTGVNAAANTVWSLPPTMAPGEVLHRTDDEGDNYFGADIPWVHNNFGGVGRRGWVMLVNAAGELVDFVAWGYDAAALSSINLNVGGFDVSLGDAWLGSGIAWGSGTNAALLRTGGEDTDTPADWGWAPLSRGSQNAGIQIPFPGGFETLAASPATASFENGMWRGSVTFDEVGNDVLLLLDDGLGQFGLSDRFDVSVPSRPVITSPSSVIAVAGRPFSYQITASNYPATFGASDFPPELTFDAAAGLLSGSPASAGVVDAMVSASNAGGTGTLPLRIVIQADSDGDGMPDEWEDANALDAGSAVDATQDKDGDTLDNLGEFLAGTDPGDPASLFRIDVVSDASGITLVWGSVAGKRYRVSSSENLIDWQPVAGGEIIARGPTSRFGPLPLESLRKSYRMETGLDY